MAGRSASSTQPRRLLQRARRSVLAFFTAVVAAAGVLWLASFFFALDLRRQVRVREDLPERLVRYSGVIVSQGQARLTTTWPSALWVGDADRPRAADCRGDSRQLLLYVPWAVPAVIDELGPPQGWSTSVRSLAFSWRDLAASRTLADALWGWRSFTAKAFDLDVSFPLWPLLAGPAVFAAWRWRRCLSGARLRLCGGCDYPRTGLPRAAPCPECGRPAPGGVT